MKNISLILFISIFLYSCYYDNKEDLYPKDLNTVTCDTTSVTYSGVVSSIMTNSCATTGCHVGNSPAGNPPIDLSNYNDVKTYGLNGQLMDRMNRNSGAAGAMPLGAQKLSSCQLSQINAWINAGALNN